MLSILVNLFGSSKRSADALDNDACTTGPPAQRLRLASSSAAPPTPTRTVPSAFRGPVRLAVVKPRRTHSDIDLMFPNTLVYRLDLSANRLQWAVNEKTPSLIDVLYHVNSVEDLWTCLRFSTAAEGQIAAVKIVITPNGALTKRSAARSILTHISNSEGCRVTSLVVVVAPGHVQYLDPLPDEINLPMLKELDINPRLIVRVADMGANPEYFRSTKLYTTLYGVLRARLQRDAIDVQLCVIYAFANIRTVRLGTPFDVKGHMSSPFLPRLQRLELDLTSGWQAKNIHDVQLWFTRTRDRVVREDH